MQDLSESHRNRSIVPGAIWLDDRGEHINAHGGGILRFGGAYYWFGEHKTEGEQGNLANVGVGVYRSADLLNWENLGIALEVSHLADHDLTAGCILERPKVIYCPDTNQFVMGFHLEPKGAGYSGARYGVAISESVAGPYRYLGSRRPNANYWPINVPDADKSPLTVWQTEELHALNMVGGPVTGYPVDRIFRRDFAGGQMSRDMTLFVDDDGIAYHFYASEDNGVLHVAGLASDFISHTGRYARLFPGAFREAPAVFKRRGKYYLFTSYCTGWAPNPASVAVADSIWGPWTDLGNPVRGTEEERATTFQSQSAFVLPVADRNDAFIFMADRWQQKNAIDGRYVWLPIEFDDAKDGRPFLQFRESWNLSVFD